VDPRAERIAVNEAIFRDVNEKVADFPRGPLDSRGPIDFVCECGDGKCHERVRTSRAVYEEVRSDPLWFMVVPSHVAEDVERVVQQHDAYWVLEKIGETKPIVIESDPRS
jgi:hypothetical protein